MIVIIQGRDDGGWVLHGSSVEGEKLAISRYISKVELECFPGRYNGGVQKRKKGVKNTPWVFAPHKIRAVIGNVEIIGRGLR